MKNIFVISEFHNKILRPFGDAMHSLFSHTFNTLGMSYTHVYDLTRELDIKDSIIIFFMPPERVLEKKALVVKNNNFFIFWNVEPCSIDGYGGTKYINRAKLIEEMLQDKDIDHVWAFDEKQVKYFNNKKLSFLPMGCHEAMAPPIIKNRKENKKSIKRICVFLGHMTTFRKIFIKVYANKARRERIKDIKLVIRSWAKFKSQQHVMEDLGYFRIGLDMFASAEAVYIKSIHWHRIMMYGMCGVTMITQSDLSNYGFIDGYHYTRFGSAQDFVKKVDAMLRDSTKTQKMARRMTEKLKHDFYMPKLMKDALRGLGLWTAK